MPASPSDSDPQRPSWTARKARVRRAWWVGGGVSVVLHLLLLFFYRGVAGPPSVSVSRGAPSDTEIRGLELLNLSVQVDPEPEQDPERPAEPEVDRVRAPEPEPDPDDVERAEVAASTGDAPIAEGGAEEEVARGPSAAERLRIRSDGDVRLFAPLADEALGALSPEQILAAELAWRLRGVNDSMAAVEQRRADATDWTYTDEEGNRWGISPGKIHLGSITLPLPFAFGVNPGRYEETQERAWLDAELSRGAANAIVWESLQERAREIRERRDRERAEERARTIQGRGPRRAFPDSSGVVRPR